ncbi:RNB domain-containing ribonuclease [Granulicella mallensis]|uniref:Exoribonuclease-2 n=1 Tax=Granulicella mallensis TaxID=940614 RepID=A0A7W7ZPN5_9BACT|nr:RNB domain-containing ribonuclease [Granulicella mallensis]MBB5063787.1 exoribonuclease-2 [Granulicella mallensis]
MSEHDRHRQSNQQQHGHSESHPPQHNDQHNGNHQQHGGHGFDLASAALDEMHAAGFKPEFGAGVAEELAATEAKLATLKPVAGVEDLRALGWSSIDNDTSKDLDQIEVAERVAGGIKLRVAIGDVAAAIEKGSPIDKHAQDQTQTIYTAVKNFPMLPLELSTGLTSLNENGDRQAVMMSFTVGPEGQMLDESVSRALVRNRAQLAYSRVGPWLENTAAGKVDNDVMSLRSDSAREHDEAQLDSGSLPQDWLVEQLKLQDEAAQALHEARVKNGALEFHKAEADPVVVDGRVIDVHEATQNRAMNLIEDLMVAANGVMARALRKGGRSGLQRVVIVPKRWDRIVALAAQHGGSLPTVPDSVQLNNFLEEQRRTDSIHYPDLAVAVIKLMGPGEYLLMRPDDDPTGHFGLAARDYTHSTAPNRRFPDLVTQRVLHAMAANEPAPYSDAELIAIAQHCNEADKALRKIERDMQKRVAAVAMSSRIGEVFPGVVTGASDKGVYVRVIRPPFEGRVVQGEDGLDVGDKVNVKLIHTDPARAFIDFAKVSGR